MNKAAAAFRTISEVSDDLNVPKHVLRFWESKFPQVKPMKRGGGRRYYRPEDVGLLRGIRHLLHAEGYTIKGVQKILREQGVEIVKNITATNSSATAQVRGTSGSRGRRRGGAPRSARGEAGPAPAAKNNQRNATLEVITNSAAMPPDVRQTILDAIQELRGCRTLLIAKPNSTVSSSRSRGTVRAAR